MTAMARRAPIAAVLFDLDGTLLDTAPDLIAALNAVLEADGLPPCPAEEAKPFISGGVRAMLGYWFVKGVEQRPAAPFPQPNPVSPAHAGQFDRLIERMLDHYQDHLACHTRYFDGMETVLDELDARALPWGIVTNKLSRFTDPLAGALALNRRPPCIISGDTLAERKPHPLPLLEASRRLGREAGQCVYIGDAARDIEAGRRAGMATLAALYGYIAADDDVDAWGADDALDAPGKLLHWIEASR
jgi:N-acetyl-D-muramate 6-phosphate phosphatase